MSLSCFCTSDSCLKSLFHLKYSSERWSYLAASLSPVQPGYTTRFAFKEGLTACPTPAVRLAVRGWLECTPLWELLRSCIWWWDNFPRPPSPPHPLLSPCPQHEPFSCRPPASPLAVQSPQIKFLTEGGAGWLCEKKQKNVNPNTFFSPTKLISKGGSRATSWNSGPHWFVTRQLPELLISNRAASPPCTSPSSINEKQCSSSHSSTPSV